MGICYSQEEQWKPSTYSFKNRRKKKKIKGKSQVIQQQKTIYETSFNDPVQSFRQNTQINEILLEASIAIGSIVDLSQIQQQALEKSLQTRHSDGQPHNQCDVITLCNLKSKNFLHTHKVRLPQQCRQNQVSCCPYTSTHIIEYDLWKLIKAQTPDKYYIYHPFTQRFLNVKNDEVVCSQDRMEWQVRSFGTRRKGGYIKIICQQGEVCMTSTRGLLPNHRKLTLCNSKHIGHIWQVKFGEIADMLQRNS